LKRDDGTSKYCIQYNGTNTATSNAAATQDSHHWQYNIWHHGVTKTNSYAWGFQVCEPSCTELKLFSEATNIPLVEKILSDVANKPTLYL